MNFDNIPFHPKPMEQINEIVGLLSKTFLTKNIEKKDIEKIAGAMKPRSFKKGQDIITYGDFGEEYFVLAKGTVRVLVYKNDTDPKDPKLEDKIAFQKTMEAGEGFGELALMYNSKRTATIRAETDEVETYVLDGTIFKTIIIKSSIDKRNIQSDFLNKIPMFGKLIYFYNTNK